MEIFSPESLDPSLSFTKKKSKVPFVVFGCLAASGMGYYAYSQKRQHDNRLAHAAFLQRFQELEKGDIASFWTCILGSRGDPNLLTDNLQLSRGVEAEWGNDPLHFPARVQKECTPKALDAEGKVAALAAPHGYEEALKKYAAGLAQLAVAFNDWAKVAPSRLSERQVGKRIEEDGNAWHAFSGGKATAAVAAYDRFLHCAIPHIDKMKDGQAVVEYLFKACRDPKFDARLERQCGEEVTVDTATERPGLRQTLRKFQSDDRELRAFSDCLRRGRAGKQTDDLADVGRAWVAFMESGREIRRLGQEALGTRTE